MKEFIVILDGETFRETFSRNDAISSAKQMAAANVGKEVSLYRREIVFKSRIVVDDDQPIAKDVAK